MKKYFLLIIVLCLFSSAYSLESTAINSGSILMNTWTWQKSIGGANNPYISTPKSTGFNKKIAFTPEGRVITYKDNVEIRNNPYQTKKGISIFDESERDLISFEGKTYIIEKLDNQNLTIISNHQDATRIVYKR